MAEGMALDLLKSSVEKLLFAAVKEIRFAAETESHITSLANTKAMIDALLLDVDATVTLQDGSHLGQQQLQRLSSALDKIDDLLDEAATRSNIIQLAGFKDRVRLFFSVDLNPLVSLWRDVGHVKGIRKELDSIAKDHALLGTILSMLPQIVSQTPSQSREMGSDLIKEEVIGRDQDREDIITRLLDSPNSPPFTVTAIVGIGGLGKTTLAQYVYHDERVEKHFDILLWVYASRDFDAKVILEKIIASAAHEIRPHNIEMNELQYRLRKQIESRKYLLVLDDIWDDNQRLRAEWQKLKTSLAHGGAGSKVLITTRDEKVAQIMGSIDPYKLGDLGETDSWLLFQRVAFTQGKHQPGLEKIGQEIVEMCPSVPLVIRTIAGTLGEKPTIEAWLDFKDKELPTSTLHSDDLKQSLKLSYNQLDPRLKLCFAHCSSFPKGFQFDKYELINIWIALGYVKERYEGHSLENAGEEYVLNLIYRGFFHNVEEDRFGCVTTFNMHDLMHDLAILVAGSKYKNKMLDSHAAKTLFECDERVGHVYFDEDTESSGDLTPAPLKIKDKLLSFKMHLFQDCALKFRSSAPSRFQSLRVLRLSYAGLKKVPRSIGGLIHLRYLDLSGNHFNILPNSITQLANLFFLSLSDCSSLDLLPRDMCKLAKLRHLHLIDCDSLKHMPLGLGNLTDLQTLDLFVVGEERSNSKDKVLVGGLHELNCLNSLKGPLTIIVNSDSEHGWAKAGAANLQGKEKLVALYIQLWPGMGKEKSEIMLEGLQPHANLRYLKIAFYEGKRLPSWMRSWDQLHYNYLPNLIRIDLSDFEGCRYLGSFGRLPHLEVLELRCMDKVEYIEKSIRTTTTSNPNPSPSNHLAIDLLFPRLKKLQLYKMPKLKRWRKIMSTSGTGSSDGEEEEEEEYDSRRQSQVPQYYYHYHSAFPRLKKLEFHKLGLEVVPREFQGLSSLKSLHIKYCSKLKAIPAWIDNLTSLKELRIWDCPKLTSLPEQMANLSSLESLSIRRCVNLQEGCWASPNLKELRLYYVGLEVIPEGFRGLSLLESLQIEQCKKLKELPEWIDSLTSLEELYIFGCPKLTSLPKQMTNMSNLESLEIIACPYLKERCRKPSGDDWPLIQHIPHIVVW